MKASDFNLLKQTISDLSPMQKTNLDKYILIPEAKFLVTRAKIK